jgi:hypothetical protein
MIIEPILASSRDERLERFFDGVMSGDPFCWALLVGSIGFVVGRLVWQKRRSVADREKNEKMKVFGRAKR